jgi:hypothetical protein
MDWAVYGSLIASFASIVIAAILLVREISRGWRGLKRFRRLLARGLMELADKAEKTSLAAERVSDQRELEASLARLRVGLARFNVLLAAANEVEASLTRVTSVFPLRK